MSYDGWRPVRFDDFVPGMKKSNLSILFWTVLFLINLVLTAGFEYMFVYNIPQPNMEFETAHGHWFFEDFSEAPFFEGCEILDATGGNEGDFYLYRDADGVLKIVRISSHSIFRGRYRIEKSKVQTVPAGDDVLVTVEFLGWSQTLRILNQQRFDVEHWETSKSLIGFFLHHNGNQTLGIYMVIAAIMLLVEYTIYEQFRKMHC